MSRPDFVQFILDTLDNWNTSNYSPKPTLIDQRDSERQGSGETGRSFDRGAGSVIMVGTQPTTTTEAIGTSYDLRYTSPVNVRCVGTIAAEHGDVTDAADWESFLTEAKRLIHAERVQPTSDTDVRWLHISEEADASSLFRDDFRTDFTVDFHGFETLP